MDRMDAISMLKDDHKTVEQLFKRFEKAGDRAHVEKGDIVDRIIETLSMHAAIEEQLFYPSARTTVADTEDIVLESLEEHHIVKWVLSELDSMSPEDERFDAKVTVLIENVRHHVQEEEQELFPMVRNALGRNSLGDLGKAMAAARKVAPTHPHPRSPDTPPGNLVAGAKTGVADRILDTVNGLAQGYVTAVGDVIAIVLGRKRPRVSPTGSKATRTTARQVRSASSDADRGGHRSDPGGQAHRRACPAHGRGHGIVGRRRRERHSPSCQAGRGPHGIGREGRQESYGHLGSDVDQADGRQCQAGRDHHRTNRSHGGDRLDISVPT